MSRNIFTYGSLMFAPVWQAVVRGDYQSECAVLIGAARHVVRGETYPGMVPHASRTVSGTVYFDVGAADLATLDLFEGEDYRRAEAILELADGRMIQAQTYFYTKPAQLLEQEWLPESFDLMAFMAKFCTE